MEYRSSSDKTIGSFYERKLTPFSKKVFMSEENIELKDVKMEEDPESDEESIDDDEREALIENKKKKTEYWIIGLSLICFLPVLGIITVILLAIIPPLEYTKAILPKCIKTEVEPGSANFTQIFEVSEQIPSTLHFPSSFPSLFEVQMKGTFRSYHKKPTFLPMKDAMFTHEQIEDQLEVYGARSLDFDLHYLAGRKQWSVFNKFIDSRSWCYCLSDCMSDIKRFLLTQDGSTSFVTVYLRILGCNVEKVVPAAYDALYEEIFHSFDAKDLVYPNYVQQNFSTMREAVENTGWPKLMLGKVLFILEKTSDNAACVKNYQNKEDNKFLFVGADNADYENEDNDIVFFHSENEAKIQELLDQNLIVKCIDKEEKCISGGAQIVLNSLVDYEKVLESPWEMGCNDVTAVNCTVPVAPEK